MQLPAKPIFNTHADDKRKRKCYGVATLLRYSRLYSNTEQHHLISARNKNIKRFSFTAAPHKKNLLKNLRQQQLLLKIT